MSRAPNISEAEWEVMKTLWTRPPRTANEIIEELASAMSWSPKTIRTLLNRLVKKKVISYHKDKVYAYYPLLSEEECLRTERRSFIQRVYGGSLKPLFVHFLQDEKLSKEDIADLKKILDEESE